MPALKHVHTYIRSPKNKKIFKCLHPDCSHYASIDDLRGKRAHCTCGVDFVLEMSITNRHFKRKLIKCDNCIKTGNVKRDVAAAVIMDEAMHPQVDTVLSLPGSDPIQLELDAPDIEGELFADDMEPIGMGHDD